MAAAQATAEEALAAQGWEAVARAAAAQAAVAQATAAAGWAADREERAA